MGVRERERGDYRRAHVQMREEMAEGESHAREGERR